MVKPHVNLANAIRMHSASIQQHGDAAVAAEADCGFQQI